MKTFGIAVMGFACLLAGCDRRSGTTESVRESSWIQPASKRIDIAEWTEEVLLHDGTTVVVWRRVRAYAGGFPNSSRGRDIDTEFRYEPMGVHWKHEQTDDRVRNPVAFEIFDGKAYLVLYVGERAWCKGKPPNQFLAEVVKWVNGQWIEVPASEFPADKALINLNADYWGHTPKGDAKGLIRWDGKRTVGDPGDTVKSYYERYHRICENYQKS